MQLVSEIQYKLCESWIISDGHGQHIGFPLNSIDAGTNKFVKVLDTTNTDLTEINHIARPCAELNQDRQTDRKIESIKADSRDRAPSAVQWGVRLHAPPQSHPSVPLRWTRKPSPADEMRTHTHAALHRVSDTLGAVLLEPKSKHCSVFSDWGGHV